MYKEMAPDVFYNPKPLTYDYGCVMIYFTFLNLTSLTMQLNHNHIYTIQNNRDMFGIEDKPHTTLLYGLHSNVDVKDVAEKLSDIEYSVCKVDNISLFQNKYDVLKYDVSGSGLYESNEMLKQFPHTTDYPTYHPHLTIAYLKSGTGDRYVRKFKKTSHQLRPNYLVYTTTTGKKYQIDIKVKK